MNWKNLKINKCPQCDGDFIKGMEIRNAIVKPKPISMLEALANRKTEPLKLEKVMMHSCGFQIRESRYSQIVNNQVTADLERQWNKEAEEQDND